MRVRELMSYSPTCCTYSCTAQKAALIMQQNDIGFLPVVDTEVTRKLIGVVTDRDLCSKVVATARDPALVWVYECMTPDPVTCGPDDEVDNALQLMQQRAVRRLPVVDSKHQILGVVSLTDVVHRSAAPARDVCVALGRIAEPHRKGQAA